MDKDTVLQLIAIIAPTGTVSALLTWALTVYQARRKERRDDNRADLENESLAISTMEQVLNTVRKELQEMTVTLDRVETEASAAKKRAELLHDDNLKLRGQLSEVTSELEKLRKTISGGK